jgi:predicted DNA-binding transcriptional regulator YafY
MPRPAAADTQSVQFDYDVDAVRRPDEPSESNLRLFWLFLELLRHRQATYRTYARLFERDAKTFTRDVAKLRKLGTEYGFVLGRMTGLVVRLDSLAHESRVARAPADGADALRALADAFGDVVAASISSIVDLGDATPDRFLRVASPRLFAQTGIGEIYRHLRRAWADHAMVRFRYPDAGGGRARERIVEPHATTYHAGRYYLIGWDVRPRVGWRQFALDRIEGSVSRAGTFRRRVIPPAYRGEDAIGLFKTPAQTATQVTVLLSPRIAQAVTARMWQAEQRVEPQADGSARLTFLVYDLGEAVRWACGFGLEATVVAPERAVSLARSTVAALAERYAERDIHAPSREAS